MPAVSRLTREAGRLMLVEAVVSGVIVTGCWIFAVIAFFLSAGPPAAEGFRHRDEKLKLSAETEPPPNPLPES